MDINALVGEFLVKKDLTGVKTTEISTNSGSVIGLYFSEHGCPPCPAFTPKLAGVYNVLKTAQKDFEVIFVSGNVSPDEFKSYIKDMPWPSIPFDNDCDRQYCREKYLVNYYHYKFNMFPALVLLNGANGEVITYSGCDLVDEYGAEAFSFNETRVEEWIKEKRDRKDHTLAEMELLSFMNPLVKADKRESGDKVENLISSCEALAVAFIESDDIKCVISKLVKVQNELGRAKLGLVVVPIGDIDEIKESDKLELKDVLMVKSGESSNNVKKRFEEIFCSINAPHVTILKKRDDKTLRICAEEATGDIFLCGSDGFPWGYELLEALEAKKEASKEELKSKQKDLDFFLQFGRKFNKFGA